MLYVFDSSFVGALVVPNEKDPRGDKSYGKIKDDDEKHAPELIWYELADIFDTLLRRGCYSPEELSDFFPLLEAIRMKTDHESGAAYSERLFRLCGEYNLSSRNAAYLELAIRKKAVLCTMDENLKKAAKKHGVVLFK